MTQITRHSLWWHSVRFQLPAISQWLPSPLRYWSNPQLDVPQATCCTGSELNSQIPGHAHPSHSPPQWREVPCLPAHYIECQHFPHSLSSSAPTSRRPGFSAVSPPLCPACHLPDMGWTSFALCFSVCWNGHPTGSAGAASTTTETPAPRSLHWEAFPTLRPSSHACAHRAGRAPPSCAGAGHLCLTSCAGSAAGSLFHFGISTQKSIRNPWVVQKMSHFTNKWMGFLFPKSVRLRLWHLPF